jgi:molybdenum cofactor cytidylyltransferase
MKKKPTAGIILAAGMSIRFGSLKQLIKIGEKTILSMVLGATERSELDQIVLVLGHQSDAIIKALGEDFNNPRLRVVINPAYREGMSGSLQRGLLEIKDDFPSVMVILGDYPFLKTDIIDLILNRFWRSDKDICVPVHEGKRGLPVCIGSRYYSHIFNITGDKGAREIIKGNPDDVLYLEIDDPGCFRDIDREDDIIDF